MLQLLERNGPPTISKGENSNATSNLASDRRSYKEKLEVI